jgi:hypothetical protein
MNWEPEGWRPPSGWPDSNWPNWAWPVYYFATIIGFLLIGFYGYVASAVVNATCREPPAPADVLQGRHRLLVLMAVALAPWLLAAVWIRPRRRLVISGLICTTPAAIYYLVSFHFWHGGGFCF